MSNKISYDAKSNMLEIHYNTHVAKHHIRPDLFLHIGCKPVLQHFKKDHPKWAREFNALMKKATTHCSEQDDPDAYAKIQAHQLASYINTKWHVFNSQIKRKIQPDLGR
jgi:hypothetical protein